jgi:hypothetical protein
VEEKNQEKWLGKGIENPLDYIKELWDGKKLHQYQHFWNLELVWELPISCTNEECKMIF